MLMGKVLAESAMRENKYITWLPSYGAEVRGGTSHCMVVISDTEIGSPYIDKADTLIIMNEPSLAKFKHRIKNRGLLIANSSLVVGSIDKPRPFCNEERLPIKNGRGKNTHTLRYPFTDIAIRLGNIKVANMVALGCLIAQKNTVRAKSVFEVMRLLAPAGKKNLITINKKALEEGMRLI
jgi:2-oxoglutarate ferredoxin oxidoreductase subunit gamma